MKRTLSIWLALCLLTALLPVAQGENLEDFLIIQEDDEAVQDAVAEVADDLFVEDDAPEVSEAPEEAEEAPAARYARLLREAPVCRAVDDAEALCLLPEGSRVLVVDGDRDPMAVAFACDSGITAGFVDAGSVAVLSADETSAMLDELLSGSVLLYENDLDRPLPWAAPVKVEAEEEAPAPEAVQESESAEDPEPVQEPAEDVQEAPDAEAVQETPEAVEPEKPDETVEPDEPAETAETVEPDAPGEADETVEPDAPEETAEVAEPQASADEAPAADEALAPETAGDDADGDPSHSPDAPVETAAPEPSFAPQATEPPMDVDALLASMGSGTETAQTVIDASMSSDDQFAGYASRILYSDVPGAVKTNATTNAGAQLTGQNLAIYNALKAEILKIAAGSRSSTVVSVPVSKVLGKTTFTASQVADMLNDGAFTWDINEISEALWLDCTYEMYWFDRYQYNLSASWPKVLFTASGSKYTVDGKAIVFNLPVLSKYRLNGDRFTVNTSLIKSAKTAADNAKAIVKKYAAYSDYVKLFGYAKEICDLVDYNAAAADASWLKENPQSQDPWKLIWVFDGNKSTNVVCEGYAQAFQYLCELTDFNDGLRCIMVTGYADGEGHSWNIVRMDDGKNYLVDVTWMDTSSYLSGLSGSLADWIKGEKGGLFLCGAGSGSVTGGYSVNYRAGGTTRRTYWSTTLKAYSSSMLTLAKSKYVLTGFQRIGNNTYFFDSNGKYVTGTQKLNDLYLEFDSSGRLLGVPTGWHVVDGKRYFFEDSGVLHTRHTAVTDKAVAATCTKTGKTAGSHCSVCGTVLVAQKTVAAKGHTPVTDKAVAATCVKTGLTAGSHCSVCKVVLKAQKTVPLAAHTPVTDKAVAATCAKTGLTAGSHCSVCKVVLKAQKVVPLTAHTPVTDKAVAATYTKTGLTKGSHCSVCKAVLKAQKVVPKLNCDFHMKKSATKSVNIGVPIQIVVDGKTVKSYSSSNKKVATVSKKGWVTTKKAGTAKITIKLKGNKKLTLTVKVIDPYAPKTIKITNGKKATLKKGKKLTLKTTLTPSNAKTTLKWSTSNKKVATVSSKGVVTAKKKGKAKITVKTANGKKATITITVKK